MEIYQLRTFVTVAKEGSITRASEQLFLSQPAASAHIKSMEDELGLPLFERTARGMSLTAHGSRLLSKAEQMLALHRDLLDEARRIKGQVGGKFRLGANRNANAQMLGKLLAKLTESYPEIDLSLEHDDSAEILRALRNGALDAGFYIDAEQPESALESIEVMRFDIFLAAPRGWLSETIRRDWQKLAQLPWIGPAANTCCGRAAEQLFERHGFRPQKFINADQESVTRTLIAGGIGIGLLHADTARDAEAKGEVELLANVQQEARLLFAYLRGRAQDPLLRAVTATLHNMLQT